MIDVFVLAWNEERMINQFIDWYSYANITVLDNHSTDRTAEIARSRGCQVVPFGGPQQDNRDMTAVKEECWRGSKADWVFVCDMDEFLYHPKLLELLAQTDTTVIKAAGYHMISEETDLLSNVKTGVKDFKFDKYIGFRPNKIQRMNWLHGCHLASPEGEVRTLQNSVKRLHYNMVGRQTFKDRRRQYRERMSQWDIENGAGMHYLYSEEEMDAEFNALMAQAKVVW